MWNGKRDDRLELPKQLRLDPEMGKLIRERAKLNRRTVQLEILFLLERSLLSSESAEVGFQPAPSARVASNGTSHIQVAEIVRDDETDGVLEPFFQNKAITHAIKKISTVPQQRKWHGYFEQWGCLVCGKTDGQHVSQGMCGTCHHRTTMRLQRILRLTENERPDAPPFDPNRLAELARASVRDHTELAGAALRRDLRKIVGD